MQRTRRPHPNAARPRLPPSSALSWLPIAARWAPGLRKARPAGAPFLSRPRSLRGNHGRALLSGESKARIVRKKRGVDMHHVELALIERGERPAQDIGDFEDAHD